MKKRIDSAAAPYPPTNTSEREAVTTFMHILDQGRVKSDLKVLDKIPNTDGTLELVTTSQIPIGKLEVQIKKLDRKNIEKPKYQSGKTFLSYCESSILPVLLIVVDVENSIAYWQHIGSRTILSLSKKLKKETVNIDFDKDNVIQKGKIDYIEKWIEIIENYREKIYDFDILKIQKEELESKFNELQKVNNISIGKSDPMFKELHLFLDYYNRLLDDDFVTVKDILYPNFWKIGVGVYLYLDNSAQFVLYPVLYEMNEVQIKQYNSEDELYLQRVLSYVRFNFENPIKNRPQKYAYELVENDAVEVLEKHPLLVKDQFMASEYILAFINKYYEILGLDSNRNEYSISEIEYSLDTFLPVWIQRTFKKVDYRDIMEPSVFVIDYVFLHLIPAEIQKISQEVKQAIKKGEQPSMELKITSTDFNVHILLNLITYLKYDGVANIKREYETKHQITKSSYYIWEAWGGEKTMKNIKVFYDNFIRIYDLLVQTYFLKIKNDLQFYNKFNFLVIVIDFSDISPYCLPSVDYYYFKSFGNTGNKTVIYNSIEKNIPVSRNMKEELFNSGLTIEGNLYELIGMTSSVLRFIYEETPIFTSITKLLKDRLKEYFKDKKNAS